MDHPTALNPRDYAVFSDEKMGKVTLFRSDHLLVGLNCFEPGQGHALHAHADMDKVYQVVEGAGLFLLEGEETTLDAGMVLVAPAGVPHGIRNTSDSRLIVMTVLAPGPTPKR